MNEINLSSSLDPVSPVLKETGDTGFNPFYLKPGHPLFSYLIDIVYPQLGAYPDRPRFIVLRMSETSSVYRLTEEASTVSVVGKGIFLPLRLIRQKLAWLEQEYCNLLFLRSIGFDGPPYRVARPLGNHGFLRLGLFQEWEMGSSLDYYFQRAIYHDDRKSLFSRLETLAFFLARLHQETATGRPMDWSPLQAYYHKVLSQLAADGLLPQEGFQDFCQWISRWLFWLGGVPTGQVLVHGDATPTNFLFPSESELVALDLERMKPAARVWDLGLVCGEIKHAFLWRLRYETGAEPFIGHFLRSYASFFDNDRQMFERICRLVPLIMAVTELRIARNRYLDRPYRSLLIREAAACLASGFPAGGTY